MTYPLTQKPADLLFTAAMPGGGDPQGALVDALRTSDGSWDALRCALLLMRGADEARATVSRTLQQINPEFSPAEQAARAARLVEQVSAASVELTGAEVVALLLADSGTEQVFGYAGTSELPLCDAVEATPGMRLINGRGDKESAFMAAGASLLRPRLGAAILHGARGLTNAAGGLADARRNEAGTVYVVGLPSTGSIRFLPPHGEAGLMEAMGTFARWSWEAPAVPKEPAARSDAALTFVRSMYEAVSVAGSQPWGPVLFGVPQDVAEARWIPVEAIVTGRPATDGDLSGTVDQAAFELIRAARRPVLLIDDYALRSPGVRPALDRLSRRTGAAVLQLRYRRGPMLFERLQTTEVANFVGWLNQYSAAHRALLDECDLLITLEDRNIYQRVVGDLPGCRKVAINSDPAKVYKNEYLGVEDMLVEGDPATVLTALADRLDLAAGGEAVPAPWFPAEVREGNGINPEAPSGQVYQGRREVAGAIAGLLGQWAAPVVVDDSQMFGGLLAEHYDDLPSGLRVFGGHGGFVGGGLAYAIGLAIAEPDVRVLCTLGDQAFTNSYQALVAAVQEKADLLVVVCNNGHSVSLNKQAAASYGPAERRYLDNVTGFRYQEVARAIGLHAEKVEVPIGAPGDAVASAIGDLTKALERAAAATGPALVELVLPSDPEAWRGIWLTQGFEQVAAVSLA